jgi:hypothetical protein
MRTHPPFIRGQFIPAIRTRNNAGDTLCRKMTITGWGAISGIFVARKT